MLSFSAVFLPYLEESYTELLQLLDYPASRVKKGAITALGQYCCCIHDVSKTPPSPGADPTASHIGSFSVFKLRNRILPTRSDLLLLKIYQWQSAMKVHIARA